MPWPEDDECARMAMRGVEIVGCTQWAVSKLLCEDEGIDAAVLADVRSHRGVE